MGTTLPFRSIRRWLQQYAVRDSTCQPEAAQLFIRLHLSYALTPPDHAHGVCKSRPVAVPQNPLIPVVSPAWRARSQPGSG